MPAGPGLQMKLLAPFLIMFKKFTSPMEYHNNLQYVLDYLAIHYFFQAKVLHDSTIGHNDNYINSFLAT